ncbi:hypothetical protein PLESTF_001975500 [Pleodorina starrii]|nr:hypothetical protein PLESTF_001975500 [Pleodorina starrii]
MLMETADSIELHKNKFLRDAEETRRKRAYMDSELERRRSSKVEAVKGAMVLYGREIAQPDQALQGMLDKAVREGRVIQFFMKALHRSLRQLRVAYEAECQQSLRLEGQVDYLKKLLEGVLIERKLEREEVEWGQQYFTGISGAYGKVCRMVMDLMVAALGEKVDDQITAAFAALEVATPGVPVTVTVQAFKAYDIEPVFTSTAHLWAAIRQVLAKVEAMLVELRKVGR